MATEAMTMTTTNDYTTVADSPVPAAVTEDAPLHAATEASMPVLGSAEEEGAVVPRAAVPSANAVAGAAATLLCGRDDMFVALSNE